MCYGAQWRGLWLVGVAAALQPVWAQDTPPQETPGQTIRRLEDQQAKLLQMIRELESELAALKERRAAVPTPQTSAATSEEPSTDQLLNPPVPTASESVESATTRGAVSLNPDMSVVGDFVINLGDKVPELGTSRHDTINRHVEVALSQRVSPEARAVAKFAYGTHLEAGHQHQHEHEELLRTHEAEQEGATWHSELELEEAYLQFDQLVPSFQFRFGRERVPVMLFNQLDGHELPFVDPPLAITRLFGDHGLIEDGVRVSYLLPTPTYVNLDLGVYNSRNETAFDAGASGDRVWMGRLNGYNDWADGHQELQWWLSHVRGANDHEGHRTGITMLDLHYQQFRDQFSRWYADAGWVSCDVDREGGSQDRDGYYVHLAKRWDRYRRNQVGALWEKAEGLHEQGPDPMKQWSLYYTWHRTERVRFRAQYSHTDLCHQPNADTVLFQISWVGGTHPPHD